MQLLTIKSTKVYKLTFIVQYMYEIYVMYVFIHVYIYMHITLKIMTNRSSGRTQPIYVRHFIEVPTIASVVEDMHWSGT